MGDLNKKILERESRKVRIENETVDKISGGRNGKDKAISARVNGTTYQNFKAICKARGLTSNACLNMLITDFVRENKKVLED